MKHPTWDDIRRFADVDGWEKTHAERGRKRRDHDRYRKTLPNGDVLRTRASHGNDEIGDAALVAHILRDQLRVTAAQFWDAVDNRKAPVRDVNRAGIASTDEPAHGLPDWLAVRLAVQVGLPDEEIAGLDEGTALARWNEWCRRPTA